ncbi:MAG: SusC/RagA family TonB-linked outer membrane protein [Bacteroidota bacterium]
MKWKPLHQIIRMSKYALLGIFLQASLGTILIAGNSIAQKSIEEIYVDLKVDNASIREVFKKIERKTDFEFAYKGNVLKIDERYTVNFNESSLGDILRYFSLKSSLKFKRVNENISVVRKLNELKTQPEVEEILPTQVKISGIVTSVEDGEPLPGVSILVKGTTIGTTTDFDGKYLLEVNSSVVLQFSYIGYETQEIEVGSQSVINVALEADLEQLEEIIVVGYGTQRKADVTGSVARISTETTADLPNYTVLQSLQGQIPGVNISSPERAGQDPSLRIRGNNSLTASNNPLIVVDGIIYNGSISDFNANDIETIDVLKDASAAAVYGARAANGVLLITTKIGKTDKPTFNFNTYVGFQEADKLIDVLDGQGYEQKIADYNSILLADNPNASPIELTNIELENRDNGIETDWIDKSLRTSIINNYHLSVSGQSEKTNYYISGTYFKQEGIVVNDNFDRATLNLNLTNDITDWYSVTVKTAFSSKDFSGREASLDQAYRQSPYGSFFDEDGPGGFAFLPIGDQLGEHPLIRTLIENEDKRTSLWGLISSNLEVPFIPGLKWTLNYSNSLRDRRINNFFDNETTVNGQIQNGIAEKRYDRFNDWTFDNILNYRKVFNEKHSLDLTLLLSREYREIDSTFTQGSNLVSQELGYNNLGLGEIQTAGSNLEEQNSIAQMARLNYGFDNRYAITLTVRRDGFSAFSANNKYATFPAAAFAWTLTNEDFLSNINWLNYLKLRVSYGKNGNQGIDRYSSLARIGTNQYLYGNGGTTIATFTINSLANNNLTWETTTSRNLGIDFQLFNNRLSGSIDAYLTNTEDLLQERSLPQISGFANVITNIGEVENKGIELSLNSKNVNNTNFKWSSGFIFSLNRNEIVTLGGLDADGDGIEDDDISNGWFIGEPTDAIFGFKTDGIYQLNDDIPDGFRAGDFRLVDTDGNGEITPDDRVILGARSPNFRISISNTLKYKQFSLYVLVNSVLGGGNQNFYVGDNFETRSVNRRGFTTFSERFNLQNVPYWAPNNPTNDYPRLDYSAPFDHPILENRGFARIQDISLAYSFNEAFLEKIKLQRLRAYASIKNLYTFTDWSGYNPETQSTIRDLPFLRSFTMGLDLTF